MYLVATSASNVQVKVTIKQCELIHTFQRPKYDELSCIAIVFVWKCHIVIASLKISAQSCPTMVFVSALLHSLWVFVYLGILVRSRQAPGDEIQDNIRQHGQSDTHTHTEMVKWSFQNAVFCIPQQIAFILIVFPILTKNFGLDLSILRILLRR